jgi:murein DD-endopeptidase MepM/ murein hydrolase activator NlpD
MTGIAALVLLLLTALPAAAAPQGLVLPIDCSPGADCWPLRYVDHDPGPGFRDYMCGGLGSDGHKGTDIAIRDLAAMAAGVEVRAAAAGLVDALRDGMADESVDDAGRPAIEGKECGNGIRLAHGDGWTSWYCHLRRGSLMVRQGDQVAAGQALALVGLSGDTSFPHLHFDLRHGDEPVDPFVGTEAAPECGLGRQPLWATEVLARLAYRPVLLTNAGFAAAAPRKEDVRRGWHQLSALPVTSPALVLWVEGYWVEPGDRVRFRLLGPDGGAILNQALEIDQPRQRWFGFIGEPRPGARWQPGAYAGKIVLERTDTETLAIERQVELVEP